MTEDIQEFVIYLRDVKKTSKNTEISYRRDLMQLEDYLRGQGITETDKVTRTSLNSYILYLEKNGKATTTISRELAAIKAFFHHFALALIVLLLSCFHIASLLYKNRPFGYD